MKPELFGGSPYPPVVVRHLDVSGAKEGEGIVDRIREGGDTPDVWAFTDSLAPIG